MITELEQKLRTIVNERETKLKPENLKKGITLLGVEGTLESGTTDIPVKLFETIEEMQADTSAKEGDLALVYRSEVQNAKSDSIFRTATFPATVVLPSAVTSSIYGSYRAVDTSVMFDGQVTLSKTSFRMSWYTEAEMLRIQYSSSDGITYTLTGTGDAAVDFGTEICFYTGYGEFDDNIGYFIQCGGNIFEGLYQHALGVSLPNQFQVFPLDASKYDFTNSSSGALTDIYSGETVYTSEEVGKVAREIITSVGKSCSGYVASFLNADMSKLYVISNSQQHIFYYNNIFQAHLREASVVLTTYDFITKTTTESTLTGVSTTLPDRTCILAPMPSDCVYYIGYGNSSSSGSSYVWYYISGNNNVKSRNFNIFSNQKTADKYVLAPTQLTLGNSNEVYPGKTAYGKKGVVTGDGSIWTNRTYKEMMETDYGADNIMTSNNYTFLKNTLNILNVEDTAKYKYCGLSFTPDEDKTGYKLTNGRSGYNFIYGDNIFPDTLKSTDDGRWEIQVFDKYTLELKHSIFISEKSRYKMFYVNNYMYIITYEQGYGTNWASMKTELHRINLDSMALNTTTLPYTSLTLVNIDATNNSIKCVGHTSTSTTKVRLDFIDYNLTTDQAKVNYNTSVDVYDLSGTSSGYLYIDWRMTDKGKMVGYSRYRGTNGVYRYVHLLFNGSSLSIKELPSSSSDILSSSGTIGINNILFYEVGNWIYGVYRKWNYSTNEIVSLTDTEKATYPIRMVDTTNSFGSALCNGDIRIFNDIKNSAYVDYPIENGSGSDLYYIKDNRLEFIGQYGNGTVVYPDFSKKDYTLVYACVYEPGYGNEKYVSGYKLLMNNLAKVDYTDTISPTEYKEINAMVEDVLGGVE